MRCLRSLGESIALGEWAEVRAPMSEFDGATEDNLRMAHFSHSTLRERIVEHLFVGDALRALWRL